MKTIPQCEETLELGLRSYKCQNFQNHDGKHTDFDLIKSRSHEGSVYRHIVRVDWTTDVIYVAPEG